MKKILTVTIAALFSIGVLSAQVPNAVPQQTVPAAQPQATTFAPSAARSTSDTKVFALELGTGFSYDIGAKAGNATQTVSAMFGLGEAVQAGFSIVTGDAAAHNYSLVKVSVYPVTDLAVQLAFGGDGNAAIVSGVGLGYNVFRSSTAGLTTALQVTAAYLFNDPTQGNIALGLNVKVGL